MIKKKVCIEFVLRLCCFFFVFLCVCVCSEFTKREHIVPLSGYIRNARVSLTVHRNSPTISRITRCDLGFARGLLGFFE